MTEEQFEVVFNGSNFHLRNNENNEELRLSDEKFCYDYICDLLNTLKDETIQSTKEKKYFLKVIFAMGNYAEKGDYERIIDARDNVKQRVLE